MTYLQRVINSDGQIIREIEAGTGHLDQCIVYEGKKYPLKPQLLKC
jgi:hypothetical protein